MPSRRSAVTPSATASSRSDSLQSRALELASERSLEDAVTAVPEGEALTTDGDADDEAPGATDLGRGADRQLVHTASRDVQSVDVTPRTRTTPMTLQVPAPGLSVSGVGWML
jgi:hypothetical protein